MLPEVFGYGFMHRAFLAGVITALMCPAIGIFLIPRRLSLIADTLAHVALAGVALGMLAGVSPTLGALVVSLLGAAGIERLRAHGQFQGDAALAVFLAGGFAVAVVVLSLVRGFNADLFAVLFGSIMTVTAADIWLMVGLGALVGLAIWRFYGPLFAITVNEDLARTSGVPVAALNLMLTFLTALTIVVGMRMVGVLLVSAMIVIPTLTGFVLARSFRGALGIAIGAAVLAVVVGLVAAFYLGLAAGGAVVLTALVILAAASMLAGRTPVLGRAMRHAPTIGGLALAGLGPAPAAAHPHLVSEDAIVALVPTGRLGSRLAAHEPGRGRSPASDRRPDACEV